MNESQEKWVMCPICGAKTRLKLLKQTVIRDLPLFCPKCKNECIINAENFTVEKL